VLEGSVRKAANRVRITAQLVDATTGYHRWAERYDRELQDIFAVQEEISRKIVAALAVQLTEGEQARLGRKYTENLEAYDDFVQGHDYLWRSTEQANARARELFERALTRNPDFLPTHAILAAVYSELGREDEAGAEMAEVVRLITGVPPREHLPYKDPAVLQRLRDVWFKPRPLPIRNGPGSHEHPR
jgi:hypothetical protein